MVENHKPRNYRPDIDGLRALAVLPVVVYHADPRMIPGGFLGVDVFFVISGYLITLLLCREIDAGTFRFRDFYKRRIRRLAPAFLAMISAVLIVGWMVSFPDELVTIGYSAVSAIFAVSNVYFAWNSGYFDTETAGNPLLHTWSLAVEEQFYLVFPGVVLLLLNWRPRHLFKLMVGLLATAFGIMLWSASMDPDGTYYGLQGRAWQLLAGATLATWHLGRAKEGRARVSARIAAPAVWSGLMMITVSYWLVSSDSAHPGWITVLPVLGAVLVMHAGGEGCAASWGLRLLSSPALVTLGLASYSVYLWHQPLIAFYQDLSPRLTSTAEVIGLTAGSILLGLASWSVIEKPMRHGSAGAARVILRFAAASLAMAVCAFAIAVNRGVPERLDPDVAAAAVYTHPLKDATRACHIGQRETFTMTPQRLCRYHGSGSKQPTIAVWGSSHAASLASGFLALDPRPAVVQASVSGCHPIVVPGGYGTPGKVDCNRAHDITGEYLAGGAEVDVVVIHSRWGTFSAGDPERYRALRASVERMLDAGRKVILVGSSPEQQVHVPRAMARALMMRGPDALGMIGVRRADYEANQDGAVKAFERLPDHPDLLRVSLADVFCSPGPQGFCPAIKGGVPLYFDDDHLGVEGAQMAASYIRQRAQEAGFW